MITENDRTASAPEYDETLSDLTPATKSYWSTEDFPKGEAVPDTEMETNLPDSDIITETQIV